MWIVVLQNKGIPQGATIVKLVTTQAGGSGKPTAIITTSQAGGSSAGQTPSNILGISSVQPQGTRVVVSLTAMCLLYWKEYTELMNPLAVQYAMFQETYATLKFCGYHFYFIYSLNILSVIASWSEDNHCTNSTIIRNQCCKARCLADCIRQTDHSYRCSQIW